MKVVAERQAVPTVCCWQWPVGLILIVFPAAQRQVIGPGMPAPLGVPFDLGEARFPHSAGWPSVAHAAHPERFLFGAIQSQALSIGAWINRPSIVPETLIGSIDHRAGAPGCCRTGG
jgi:hypothetical protein